LCPDELPGKEIGKTISLYRKGLLPLVILKQIWKKSNLNNLKKIFSGSCLSGGK
jgi:hypothetical protein